MNYASKRITLAVMIMASFGAQAGNSSQTSQSNTAITQSEQTQSEQKHKQWGISKDEYSRYEELMKGMRGTVSPDNISPIEVLGIHAESASERRKYARIWADMMEKDAERILAFQRAYDAAWADKGRDIINVEQIRGDVAAAAPAAQPEQNSPGSVKKMIFATSMDGCPRCDDRIQKILTSMLVDQSIQLDIYFSDSKGKDNSVIRQWAVKNNIDAEHLRTRRITLNHGQSLMNDYQLEEAELPVTYQVNRNGGVKRVE